MIYFDLDSRRALLRRLTRRCRDGGWLLLGTLGVAPQRHRRLRARAPHLGPRLPQAARRRRRGGGLKRHAGPVARRPGAAGGRRRPPAAPTWPPSSADAPGLESSARPATARRACRRSAGCSRTSSCWIWRCRGWTGFAFLRLLMPRRPTPVVVVLLAARRGDVFRALELGALDFVARPSGPADVAGGASARRSCRSAPPFARCASENLAVRRPVPAVASAAEAPWRGWWPWGRPRAVRRRSSSSWRPCLAGRPAGHPGRAAHARAVHRHLRRPAPRDHRLGRQGGRRRRRGGGRAGSWWRRGGHHMELRRDEDGKPRVRRLPAEQGAIATPPPSTGCSPRWRTRAVPRPAAVVLTGMGNDGRVGVQAIKRGGGLTLAESADTAVVYGMPQAAAETRRGGRGAGAGSHRRPAAPLRARRVKGSWRSGTP